MHIDVFFSGDELITYSTSNNDQAGFIFSDARVSKYMKEYVFTGNASENISNLMATVQDVLKNKRNSKLFSAARDHEVKLFSHEEMVDWFAKRPDERFNYGSTFIYTWGDDGQSWMYYSLINTSASIFMPISDTKWAGFIVNYLFFILTIIVLWNLGKIIGNSEKENFIILACFCLWNETTHTVTNMRSYGVAGFFATLLVIMAARIFKSVMTEECIKKSDLIKFVIVYAFGYVTHYTIGAILAMLGLVLVVFMLIQKKKHVGSVVITGIVALL